MTETPIYDLKGISKKLKFCLEPTKKRSPKYLRLPYQIFSRTKDRKPGFQSLEVGFFIGVKFYFFVSILFKICPVGWK